ncbi:thioesterase II family protein [Streptomyces cellulosae]|uniref:thioesterase II family protein n=1 Tax=Streptomyces cellulosae TaxID=1968 RepID=UPI0006921B38|nr:alpha/beta fold hydrolase [Streptomyces cellulosae]
MTKTADASCFPPCRAEAIPPPTLDADAIQLFCLPHAGAGASAYRDWLDVLAPGIEAIPVQLPGRESRHREPALHSAAELVAILKEPVANRAGTDFALFGHSMGALLSYELAHVLSALGKPPRHLFVSGLGAPHLPPTGPRLHDLPDDELLTVVARLEGTSPEVLAQPELVQLLLPLLRADLTVWETYTPVPRRGLLEVPVTAMGGRHDPSVSLDELSAWGSLTSAEFHLEVFDGGHFYHHAAPDDVTAILKERLLESSPASEVVEK